MNYQKIYDSIITRAQNEKRIKSKDGTYYERHHILPKCLNGTNNKGNLVLLTAREHFICHWLLARLYSKHFGIVNAFNRMLYFSKNQSRYTPSSRVIEEAKILFSKNISSVHKGKKISDEHKKKISQANKGNTNGRFRKGIKASEETKKKLSDFNTGKKLSEETKKKIADKSAGKIHSKESKLLMKEKYLSREKLKCPFCTFESINYGVIKRYHFENCKQK